jgi:hypothetical protein
MARSRLAPPDAAAGPAVFGGFGETPDFRDNVVESRPCHSSIRYQQGRANLTKVTMALRKDACAIYQGNACSIHIPLLLMGKENGGPVGGPNIRSLPIELEGYSTARKADIPGLLEGFSEKVCLQRE